MYPRKSANRLLTSGLLLCTFAMGCGDGGPALIPFKGKILYQDKPVPGATVSFAPAQGEPAWGLTNDAGEFEIKTRGKSGVVAGTAKVSIIAMEKVTGGPSTPEEFAEAKKAGKEIAAPKSLIPEKYNNDITSGLTVEVTSDASKNTKEFILTD